MDGYGSRGTNCLVLPSGREPTIPRPPWHPGNHSPFRGHRQAGIVVLPAMGLKHFVVLEMRDFSKWEMFISRIKSIQVYIYIYTYIIHAKWCYMIMISLLPPCNNPEINIFGTKHDQCSPEAALPRYRKNVTITNPQLRRLHLLWDWKKAVAIL